MADAPRVFISYSHDSEEHADRVLALADALCDGGIDVILDRYVHPAPAEGWPLWMERNLDEAKFVLMVCTEIYARRVMGPAEPGKGLGGLWEGRLIYNRIAYGEPGGIRFIPILLPGAEPTHIPAPVRGHNHYRLAIFDFTDPAYEALYRHLTGQPATARPGLGRIKILPPMPPSTLANKPARLEPKAERPLNEGKLIIVGRGEVGKTSIVRRLTDDEFRGDESKTQGINITTWQLRCQSETLRLNVWDFGGQEIMHAMHQFFLTERSLYLLVLNGREGREDLDAEYWLKLIESFGGDSPVIVVQNKTAQHPFDLNYRGLQARYPQIRGFAKTDCMDATGIEQLRQLIRRVAAEMPEIRMQFPSDWFAVKERLESMKDDFMGYEGFRQLCCSQGIFDESDQNTLCWVLHCLGIALNYREDPRLRETSVLKQ